MLLRSNFRCWWLLLWLEVSIGLPLLAQQNPAPTDPPTAPAPTIAFPGSTGSGSGSSSEVATQNRLGDIPVSLYTGTPIINFPIYTLQEGAIAVPISLGYNATGLRAGEVASWCGLGWTLQAGGMITRQVRGGPDEGTAADGQVRKGFYQVGTSATETDDNEPDIFVANINGQSFKFQLNNNRQFQPLPDADIRIEITWKTSRADGNVLWIDGWRITTPDGMKYYFGSFGPGMEDAWEYTIVRDANESAPGFGGATTKEVIPSAWYLRRIESSQGQTVTFNYSRVYYAYPQLKDCETAGNNAPTQYVNKVYVSALVLKSIQGKNVTVMFNKDISYDCSYTDQNTGDNVDVVCTYSSGDVQRLDIQNWFSTFGAYSKILKEILVQDNYDNNKQLRYSFNYGYFSGDFSTPRNLPPPNYNSLGATYLKRLKLTGFTFPDGTTANFNYAYDNSSISFPGLLVRGIDHWGYFNATAPSHLIGQGECQGNTSWATDRSVTGGWSQYGTLNKITLSSGQTTDFVYENHRAWNYNNNSEVGGLRIQRIVFTDAISGLNTIKEYSYINPGSNQSSGFLSLKPVYRFDSPTGSGPYYNTYLYPAALMRSGKPVVGYNYVKETTYSGPIDYNQFQTDNTYKDSFRVGDSQSWFDQDETDIDVCGNTYQYYPHNFSHKPWQYRPDLDYRAGNLVQQRTSGRDGQPISETVFGYNYAVTDRMQPSYSARNIVYYNNLIGGQNEGYSKSFYKYRLKQQTSLQYDQNGANPVETKVAYTYKDEMDNSYKATYPGKHNQIAKTTTWDSNNQATDVYMRYAVDYEFGPQTVTVTDYCVDDATGQQYPCGTHTELREDVAPNQADAHAIFDLKAKNMMAAVVETQTQKNGQTLSASYSRYKIGLGLPDVTYTLDVFPVGDFSAARYDGTNFIADSRYKLRIEYESYNNIGLPTSVKVTNGPRTQTIYGYNDLLPASVTQNAGVANMTTTYEHSPLFGTLRTIAPNGIEIRNNYEATTGRLLEVRDRYNKILKKYEYKRRDQ